MNVAPDNIIVNSCEYTPVYLIPNPGVAQPGSYIITQNTQDAPKPVTDNLKRFYENSGNLENGLLNSPKPRILKKQISTITGNNLKLASFLVPKNGTVNVSNVSNQYNITPVTNVVLKPAAAAVANVDNMVPRVEIDRKIVRIGTIPKATQARVLPKMKPKENGPPNTSKHTSVQLLKLGETYHSLNQLSDEQMKIVNKALKIFSDPEEIPKEPAINTKYDPVTNTKFIYKVVSPRDLTVVGKNKLVVKQRRGEIKKHPIKKVEKKDVRQALEDEHLEEMQAPPEPKVTRSGRKVKLPKQMRREESPQKPKKKVGSVVTCFQCSSEFCSLYRLQRHYENNPTHIPEKVHSNLFHCLLAIIEGGSNEDQANIFIQQLEQLIEKLKNLLPCLLKKIDGCDGKMCNINDDICRLFGMNPGKYNLNMEAMNCIKDKDGHCIHNPAPKNHQFSLDPSKPSQVWLSTHNKDITINEAETEDCARINSVDKWPTVSKRIWKLKQQKSQKLLAKRMRLASESAEQFIDLGMEENKIEEVKSCKPIETSAINVGQSNIIVFENKNEIKDNNTIQQSIIDETNTTSVENQSEKPKGKHAQFKSTHFDIRSSPIKLPSALVRKFQINLDNISNYEVQIMKPLAVDADTSITDKNNKQSNSDSSVQSQTNLLENIALPKDVINDDSNFDGSKDWNLTASNDDSSQDDFIKSNILFESNLTPLKGEERLVEPLLLQEKSNSLFDSPLIHTNGVTSNLLEPTLLDIKENASGFFEPAPIHVKNDTSMNSKEKSNYLTALSHVKERSKSLFESTMIYVPKNSSNTVESTVMHKANSAVEPSMMHKSNEIFDPTLSCVRERFNNLFEPNYTHTKDKNRLIGSSSLHSKVETGLFEPSLSHSKGDGLSPQTFINQRSNGLIGSSILDKESNLIDPTYINEKSMDRMSMEVDINHSDDLTSNISQLLSNQGQSVLNFLESLGNECLAYPETEIRNNSVDFQLDLFSFNSS